MALQEKVAAQSGRHDGKQRAVMRLLLPPVSVFSWQGRAARRCSEPVLPIDFRDEPQKRARPAQKQRTIRSVLRFSGSSRKVGENMARQRDASGMEGKIALPGTHISFFARHSHPYQFLMKSSDFRAQKLQGNDLGSGKWEFLPQNRPLFTRHRIRWTSERALTLSSSPRLFDSPSWRSHVIRCRSEPALPIDFRDEPQKRARPAQKQRTIRSVLRFSGRIRHYSMENNSL